MENIRNALVSVGTSAVLVSPDLLGGKRTTFSVVNTSASGQVVTLSMGQVAVANYGIVLSPGSAWSESNDSGFETWNGEIWAIASAATGQISLQERIRR